MVENLFENGIKIYVASKHEVLTGTYVSRGTSWNYVLFPDGNVKGFADHVVFETKADALEYILDDIKKSVLDKVSSLTISEAKTKKKD